MLLNPSLLLAGCSDAVDAVLGGICFESYVRLMADSGGKVRPGVSSFGSEFSCCSGEVRAALSWGRGASVSPSWEWLPADRFPSSGTSTCDVVPPALLSPSRSLPLPLARRLGALAILLYRLSGNRHVFLLGEPIPDICKTITLRAQRSYQRGVLLKESIASAATALLEEQIYFVHIAGLLERCVKTKQVRSRIEQVKQQGSAG